MIHQRESGLEFAPRWKGYEINSWHFEHWIFPANQQQKLASLTAFRGNLFWYTNTDQSWAFFADATINLPNCGRSAPPPTPINLHPLVSCLRDVKSEWTCVQLVTNKPHILQPSIPLKRRISCQLPSDTWNYCPILLKASALQWRIMTLISLPISRDCSLELPSFSRRHANTRALADTDK